MSLMESPVFYILAVLLLRVTHEVKGNGNDSVIEDLRLPTDSSKHTELTNPLSDLILNNKNENNTNKALKSSVVSRVKRQYYGDGYYYSTYPYYPLPIFVGGGFGPGFGFGPRGFGGRGFGGRGFGGRGFGGGRGFAGRGFGGRGIGGFGGHGIGGGGHGGGGRG